MKKIRNLILEYWKIDIIRFFIVGGFNTIFGYSVYAVGIFIGLHYSLATLFSIILGILFNFKTTGKIVFKNKNNRLLFKFTFVYAISYGVNLFFLSIFQYFQINNYLGGAILAIPVALLSYYLQNTIVFKKNEFKNNFNIKSINNNEMNE